MRNLIIIMLFCPVLLQAQDSGLLKKNFDAPIVKFSHLSLVDPLQSIQFALEHQLGKKVSLQHEAGYIFNYEEVDVFQSSDYYTKARGLRLRNEVRIYLNANPAGMEGFYFAPEFLYNFVRYNERTSVGRDCNGSWDCQYYEYMYYRAQKQVFAQHLKLGYQEIFFDRLAFDVYAGYGGRHVKELNVHPPEGLQANDRFHFDTEKYTNNRISISLGFKLGYLLRKREPISPQKTYPDGDYPYYIEQ